MTVIGPRVYETDEAAAFAAALAAGGQLMDLDAALTAATAPGRIDLPTGARGLVAADAVAAASGSPGTDTPTDLRQWAEAAGAGTEERRRHALEVLRAVRSDDSELCEVVPAQYPGWGAVLDDLQGRLLL